MLHGWALTFGVTQGQEDVVIQELDVDDPPIAARVQAGDLVERRMRGAADAVDNFDLRFEYANCTALISTMPSMRAPVWKKLTAEWVLFRYHSGVRDSVHTILGSNYQYLATCKPRGMSARSDLRV